MDSWVRYEQQAKESEQAALAKSVIENVLKTIQDEKTQKDILASAVAEVERECHLVIGTLFGLATHYCFRLRSAELVKSKAI